MSTESNWALRHPGRQINMSTPPPPEIFIPAEARSPALPQTMRHATPPPYEVYQPSDGMRPVSPQLNPWNPYLRSYGRVYYGVNQYENPPRNWLVSNEPSQRPLQNYPSSRIHMVPSFRDFNAPNMSALPLGEQMRRTLSRPRSNRSFLHYRGTSNVVVGNGGGSNSNGIDGREMVDDENISGYSSLPVIEISSDEDEPRLMPVELAPRPDSNNSTSARSSFNHSNKENMVSRQRFENAARSPSRRITAESKPNIHAQIRRTSSEDSIATPANQNYHAHHQHLHHHHQPDEALALNLSNRMKRPHRHSPPQSHQSKHCRINNEHRNSRQTAETTESHSGDDSPLIQARKKPNINEIDTTVNSTNASTTQAIDNDDNNIEQKFKIRIKREFKTETNNNNTESVDNETVVDTKEHLQPLIADIKQE